ncbi:MAG TPA: hypothetical protein VGT40_07155 [Methylomirabilota bacterium]|jgi:tRNA nucleotidyltransferase (CCA-adding enzyme)|nr:hypothetical protein [Methylomirabilota bacterium]
MARPGAIYPQVEPTAGALIDRAVMACPPARRVTAALEAALRAGAQVVVIGPGAAVRREELHRAARWGLGRLPIAALAWRALPTLSARASEIDARRHLMTGAPMVLVRDGGRVVGVIDSERLALARPAFSLAHRLERLEARGSDAALWLCRVAGKVGEGLGVQVFAVGGFVRDLLLERRAPDLDLLVEGDGVAFARRLVEEVGGSLVVHPDFGTASIEGAGRAALGRVDIASARRERYDAPGALPVVSASSAEDDLARRDFSVNAMAMALSPSAFGRLLDPLGGQRDLKRRRLKPLSPLSFVEDPTRIFRAARYAARLGFRLDPGGVRALALALAVGRYPALSGQRLLAEVELLAAEASGWRGFELVLKWEALRLWDRGFRVSARGSGRLRDARRLCAWGERERIALDHAEVALIALLLDQRPAVASRCLTRLALTGGRLARLRQSATEAAALARRLDGEGGRRPSEVAAMLERRPEAVLVGTWLLGRGRTRRRLQWFWSRGRGTRPLLSGDDIVALGARRGPEVGACLAALRQRRLDGALTTVAEERAFVKRWLGGRASRRGLWGTRDKRRSV